MFMKHQKCFMEEVLFELGLGGLRGSEEREGSLGEGGELLQVKKVREGLLPRVQEIGTLGINDHLP